MMHRDAFAEHVAAWSDEQLLLRIRDRLANDPVGDCSRRGLEALAEMSVLQEALDAYIERLLDAN